MMSKKTSAIYASLDKLDELNQKINEISQDLCDKNIEDIGFEMRQEIKNLRFWIESLYSYNGKSTSRAKKIASAENGKKGGRPPKQITDARKRILELENDEIPETERNLRMALTQEDEEKFGSELEKKQKELENCRQTVIEWEKQRENPRA